MRLDTGGGDALSSRGTWESNFCNYSTVLATFLGVFSFCWLVCVRSLCCTTGGRFSTRPLDARLSLDGFVCGMWRALFCGMPATARSQGLSEGTRCGESPPVRGHVLVWLGARLPHRVVVERAAKLCDVGSVIDP